MTRKNRFFEGWSWFKCNNLRLAQGINLKFYTSMAKGLELKVRKFWGLIPTFLEVTVEKLVGGYFLLPLPILNRVKEAIKEWKPVNWPCRLCTPSIHHVGFISYLCFTTEI